MNQQADQVRGLVPGQQAVERSRLRADRANDLAAAPPFFASGFASRVFGAAAGALTTLLLFQAFG